MTKKEALSIAIQSIDNEEVTAVLKTMLAALNRSNTEEQKEKRRDATAKARNAMVVPLIPIIKNAMVGKGALTAKEIYEAAKDNLPEDFSAAKVQNILLRELADSVVKTETKGKANTYTLNEEG